MSTSGITVTFIAPGEYWLLSPDQQSDMALGYCYNAAELQAVVTETVDICGPEAEWEGWTTES